MHERINRLARDGLAVEGLSISQAAEVSGVGRTKIFEFIGAGTLPARKVGKRTIVLRQDLMAFLENLPRAGAGIA
jgi:excisionase family DNA binding protein